MTRTNHPVRIREVRKMEPTKNDDEPTTGEAAGLDLVTAAKRWPAEERVRRGIDLDAIEARCEAAGEWPNNRVPLCSIGSPHQWLPEAVEAFCVAARTDIPALIARIEELETIVRLHLTECAHCGCSLYLPDGPPHCHDCLVDEDDETRWNEARALLGEEKPKT